MGGVGVWRSGGGGGSWQSGGRGRERQQTGGGGKREGRREWAKAAGAGTSRPCATARGGCAGRRPQALAVAVAAWQVRGSKVAALGRCSRGGRGSRHAAAVEGGAEGRLPPTAARGNGWQPAAGGARERRGGRRVASSTPQTPSPIARHARGGALPRRVGHRTPLSPLRIGVAGGAHPTSAGRQRGVRWLVVYIQYALRHNERPSPIRVWGGRGAAAGVQQKVTAVL